MGIISNIFLAELQEEAKGTREILSRVPFEKGDFKPHEKSMTLKNLAVHVAEISGWWKECLTKDELDFSKGDHQPKVFNSTAEIVAFHDELVKNAANILTETEDAVYTEKWTMRNGEQIYFSLPKSVVVRTWCLNHLYHHRGQLSVYLRLLDVPLPAIYGPTADMQEMA